MNTEHGRGEDGNFVRMWDEVNHCGKECKRTEGAQAMTGLFSWPKRLWQIYANDWRYSVALYWMVLAFRTADCRLAFGFGLGWLWASLFLLQWLMFFVFVGEVARAFWLLFCATCFLLEDVIAGIPLANFQKTVTTRVMTVCGWVVIPRQYQQGRGALVIVMTRLSSSRQKERGVL